MLAGGPIQGGQVYGADKEGHAPAEDTCPQVDFNATIAKACGMPLDEVVFSPSGRPFLIAGHSRDVSNDDIIPRGKPIEQLFS